MKILTLSIKARFEVVAIVIVEFDVPPEISTVLVSKASFMVAEYSTVSFSVPSSEILMSPSIVVQPLTSKVT